jgi:hypothetical protein
MYKFNEVTIDADKGIIFLCGTKYKKESVYDKRNVLKKYIEKKYPLKNVLILEEHFVFGKREGYLSYDDIFLKNLNDIETLSAAFANGIIIIHDSISTGAELAAFASNELLKSKMCVLEPDNTGVEERKISAFLELAFFGQESSIRRIVYYPEVYSFEISEKHIEKRTNFANNTITPILGQKICDFIDHCKLDLDIRFEEMKFKKVNNDLGIISYSKTDRELQVYVSGQVVLYQVMGLLSISHIRKNLRTKKRLYSHVDFVCDQYKKVLLNTIQKKLKSEVNEILVNIKEINVEFRDVIAYSLYMLQALKLISMSKENELYKISLKKNLDVFLNGIQKIVSEEDNELLEFLNE